LSIRGFGLTAATRDDSKLKAPKTFIGDGVVSGNLKPTIAKTFPFDKIVDAHHCLEAGERIGKIVVTV
jgi:NADPH:quinone reductase-like Zn-dependent oxidoreductase